MRRIAVIGAGQAGSLLAVGLQRAGYEVTLYSDRSPEGILGETAPTGTAALFAEALAVEARLGVETYADRFLPLDGAHLCFEPTLGTQLLHFGGPLGAGSGAAVDVRLKSADRMRQLEAIGGEVVIERVAPERLDRIAGRAELTVVATGKGGLAGLFERNEARSVYQAPQRILAMVLVAGVPTTPGAFAHRLSDRTPACFSLFGDAGELFWVPYLHKDIGRCWSLTFEARAGGPLDRFRDCRSPEDTARVAAGIIRSHCPWDWPTMRHMEPVPGDPHCWLTGALTPTVRRGAGRTASGHPVMSLGDTSMLYDPIGGQGAGSGTRQAGHIVDAVIARGGRPFDEAWIEAVFEGFYASYGAHAYAFNNLFLEPLDATGVTVLKACFASPACARGLIRTFSHPPALFPWIRDAREASRWISTTAGWPASWVTRYGMARIMVGQVRQRLRGRHFPVGAPLGSPVGGPPSGRGPQGAPPVGETGQPAGRGSSSHRSRRVSSYRDRS